LGSRSEVKCAAINEERRIFGQVGRRKKIAGGLG
jgi:hypothetical protein